MIEKTFNPIVREEEYRCGLFPNIPSVGAKRAVILSCGNNLFTILNDTRVRPQDIRKGKYDALTELDLQKHKISIQLDVMSRDSVSGFLITIEGMAEVSDVEAVYQEQITDAALAIENDILVKIQECAADYEIQDSVMLKNEIKDMLGTIYYINEGISLSSISVMVKADDVHMDHLKQKRMIEYNLGLERSKAQAATEVKEIYSDEMVAIFSDLAIGKISPQEAVQLTKAAKNKNFDTNMEQLKAYTSLIQEISQSELMNQSDIKNKVKHMLEAALPEMSVQSIGDGNNPAAIDQKQDDNYEFAPIDDED